MIYKHKTSRTVFSISALALLVTGAGLYAGPLAPPAGPVASTSKTLAEVEPRIAINAINTPGDADSVFRIAAPGSYYLTGNITGEVGKHGIEIVPGTGGGITLDLNGFDLRGVTGSLDGVSVTTLNFRANIAVVNGSVRNWGGDGVDLASLFVTNCRIEGILATGNIGNGISVYDASTITNCSTYLNTGDGIRTGNASTITNCVAYQNGRGFVTGNSSTLSDCAADANQGSGFETAYGCSITACTAYNNRGNGIFVLNSCTVADCSVAYSGQDGVRCSSRCLIRNSSSVNNGYNGDGAGIHMLSVANRIEGNNCDTNSRGIEADIAGNFIFRNTCSQNATNWDIVAGNVCLVVQGAGGAAILGNTGGISPGSTDPNANFTY